MRKRRGCVMLAAGMLAVLCGCGGAKTPVREEIAEQMDVSGREDTVSQARDDLAKTGAPEFFGEYEFGTMPTPDSTVSGMRVVQSVPFVYVYEFADGGDNFDETVKDGAVLAYLSVLESYGFRSEVIEDAMYIYAGSTEVAYFVCMLTPESGYRMFLQIVAV